MSEVKNREPVYAPASFPKKRRLPTNPEQVLANYHRQTAEVEQYRQQLNAQRGFRGASTCARSLHISLFFDGTNNNEPNDTKAEPPHPTNIARLYHASLDQPESGYSGVFPTGSRTVGDFVAAHKQRLCFPLDSIRYADGVTYYDRQQGRH